MGRRRQCGVCNRGDCKHSSREDLRIGVRSLLPQAPLEEGFPRHYQPINTGLHGFAPVPPLALASMQTSMVSAAIALPRADAFSRPAPFGRAGLAPSVRAKAARPGRTVRAAANQDPLQVVQPINGDPYIGMLETPVTSSPVVAGFLSNLPAYRTGVDPLLRGVEIGLAHGYFLPGPFIKLGPLRNVPDIAERSGSVSAAGLVIILTVALTIYGAVQFTTPSGPQLGVKTLSGREVQRDPLQTSDGWTKFTAGWLVGGLSGVAWCYILTQTLPYYR